jgi:hypothetical protein
MDAKALQKRLMELMIYDPETGVFTATKSIGNVAAGTVRGNKDAAGYLRFRVDGTMRLAHVYAWVYVYGVEPKGEIDHINGVNGDNRIENLRDVSASGNSHNKKIKSTAGVSMKRTLFRAKITINGRSNHIGYFKTQTEAHEAYLKEKTKVLGSAQIRRYKDDGK